MRERRRDKKMRGIFKSYFIKHKQLLQIFHIEYRKKSDKKANKNIKNLNYAKRRHVYLKKKIKKNKKENINTYKKQTNVSSKTKQLKIPFHIAPPNFRVKWAN